MRARALDHVTDWRGEFARRRAWHREGRSSCASIAHTRARDAPLGIKGTRRRSIAWGARALRALGALGALALLLAWWIHRGGDEAGDGDRDASARRGRGAAARDVRTPDERGGPLRLDGQLLDEAGAPVAGGLAVLSTEPPRTTRSQADGSFAFERLLPRRFSAHAQGGELVGRRRHQLTSTGGGDGVARRAGGDARAAVDAGAAPHE